MIRLAERILLHQAVIPEHTNHANAIAVIDMDCEALANCPVTIIDNVYYYVMEHFEEYDYAADTGCVRPPFDVMFLDCHYIVRSPLESNPALLEDRWMQRGAFIRYHDIGYSRNLDGVIVERLLPRDRDKLAGYLMINHWTANGSTKGCAGFTGLTTLVAMATEGTVLHVMDSWPYTDYNKAGVEEWLEQQKTYLANDTFIYLMALSFMNAKNVSRREASSDELESFSKKPKKQRKANKPAGPKLVYYVLDVQALPGRSQRPAEPSPAGDGPKRSRHIVRGHFREYTKDRKGMFGKGIYGSFFIHDHARGSEKIGTVAKDYRVLPPEETGG